MLPDTDIHVKSQMPQMYDPDELLLRLVGLCQRVRKESSNEQDSISFMVHRSNGRYIIRTIAHSFIHTVPQFSFMLADSDIKFGEKHLFELIKAIYWRLWVHIDEKACDYEPERLYKQRVI